MIFMFIYFPYTGSVAPLVQICILAESKGAYWSWYDDTSNICLNHCNPGYFDNL